jgi:hypothetical protein
MEYGERELVRGCNGPDVVELQVRLAGFRGTLPDGDFGPGTERQVRTFQRDYMGTTDPDGRVDAVTMQAIDEFAARYPFDFGKLGCPCRECGGFGSGKNRGKYREGSAPDEASYLYEYPGMHRMLLWAVRAAFHYMPEHRFSITSAYRCSIDNARHGRNTTNHHGKAIDLDVALRIGESKADDMRKCAAIRSRLVETADAQVGWGAPNRKALEPPDIAPTWVHYDVRCYEQKYLRDEMFCTSLAALDNPRPIRFQASASSVAGDFS